MMSRPCRCRAAASLSRAAAPPSSCAPPSPEPPPPPPRRPVLPARSAFSTARSTACSTSSRSCRSSAPWRGGTLTARSPLPPTLTALSSTWQCMSVDVPPSRARARGRRKVTSRMKTALVCTFAWNTPHRRAVWWRWLSWECAKEDGCSFTCSFVKAATYCGLFSVATLGGSTLHTFGKRPASSRAEEMAQRCGSGLGRSDTIPRSLRDSERSLRSRWICSMVPAASQCCLHILSAAPFFFAWSHMR
mmetsp:Transcript_114393/g.306753  ORF Transcript_114393/g.306753 Transcript_114393/m.306753 type:complete len:247 (+) Transcript_114393:2-742(+)